MAASASVCIIAENQSFGGMEVHTLGLMGALIDRGYHVELISNRYRGYDDLILARGWQDHIRVIHTQLKGILYGDSGDGYQWKQLLSSLHSRVLIFPKGDCNYGQISFLHACRMTFEKVVFIEHLEAPARPTQGRRWLGAIPGLGLWWYKRRILSKCGSRYADQIIAVSGRVRDRLVQDFGYAQEKVVVIRNGVSWREFERNEAEGEAFRVEHGIPADAFVFGMLTRLQEQKGIDIALQALHRLLKRNLQKAPYLVVAGEGSQMRELKVLSETLGLRKHVKFIGFVNDPTRIVSAYDVILFSSRNEGLPLALLEGMAAGCIPMVTRVSGMPEAVDSPDIGWVVSPESPAELCAAMANALALDAEVLSVMRRNAVRNIQRNFDLEECHRSILRTCGL